MIENLYLSTGVGGGRHGLFFLCFSLLFFLSYIFKKNGPANAFIMKVAPLTLPFLKTMLHSIASIVNSQSKRRIVVGSFLY